MDLSDQLASEFESLQGQYGPGRLEDFLRKITRREDGLDPKEIESMSRDLFAAVARNKGLRVLAERGYDYVLQRLGLP